MTNPQPTSDLEIVERVHALVARVHDLERQGHGDLSDKARAELHAAEVEIDRLWDLKRARRARCHAGTNPDEAVERPAAVVENYLQ